MKRKKTSVSKQRFNSFKKMINANFQKIGIYNYTTLKEFTNAVKNIFNVNVTTKFVNGKPTVGIPQLTPQKLTALQKIRKEKSSVLSRQTVNIKKKAEKTLERDNMTAELYDLLNDFSLYTLYEPIADDVYNLFYEKDKTNFYEEAERLLNIKRELDEKMYQELKNEDEITIEDNLDDIFS